MLKQVWHDKDCMKFLQKTDYMGMCLRVIYIYKRLDKMVFRVLQQVWHDKDPSW